MRTRSERAAVPAARTSFFGREREREHLTALLRRGPLATVTGIGGAGKSRLAAEVAASYDGEVAWCDLSVLPDDASVAAAVASALGRDDADATSSVIDALGDTLLVLDDCEQVLDGVAELVEAVVAELPEARVLATSREPIAIEGEQVLALGPLGDEDAVALFVDRARLVRWDFELTDENAAAVERVCRRLDGLPLAIELAAARARSMAPADIADRLDRRFELLARPRTRGGERHRTLRATIDWSYRLLDEQERLAFERLSVVASKCDLDAARAICGGGGVERDDVLDLLDRLVERSLVRVSEEAGRARYGMLETLREYGRERLREAGDEERVLDLHADWFALLADRFRQVTDMGGSRSMLLDGLAIFEEVRAACRWCIEHDRSPRRAFRLLAPLWALAHTRHAAEIAVLCEEALAAWDEGGAELRQDVIGTAAVAHVVAGDREASRAHATRAIESEAPARPALIARRALALASYWFDDDPRRTLTLLDEVVEAARALDRPMIAAEMSVLAAQALAACGEDDEALRLAESIRSDAATAESAFMRAWATYILATVVARSDPERAERCYRESHELAREIGFAMVQGNSLRQLGRLAAADGDLARAAAQIRDAIGLFSATGDRAQQWDSLRSAAGVLARAGRGEPAARILASADAAKRVRSVAPLEAGEVAALRDELGDALASADPLRLEQLVPLVVDELDALADGAAPEAEPSPGREPVQQPAGGFVFRQDGELWTLAFDGDSVHMPDLKGLHDLARLIAAPGQEIHCLDLAGTAREELAPQGHAGEVLDEEARAAYKQRIEDLREEAELAEAANDTVRAEKAREELDKLTEALASAYGLGGRPRRSGDPAERARSAVTWRIRSALGRIEEAHPALGRHLRNSVRTGTFCAYEPERPVAWEL